MTDQQTSAERIEREIQATRSDIDRKFDTLQERFSPGQMVDKAVGYVKSGSGDFGRNLGQVVRDNPVPVMLLGAGVAWLAVAGARQSRSEDRSDGVPASSRENRDAADVASAQSDAHSSGVPHGTPSSSPASAPSSSMYRAGDRVGATNARGSGSAGQDGAGDDDESATIGEKAANLAAQAQDRLADIGSGAKEKLSAASERTRALAETVRERGDRAKEATKEFAYERPLVVGAIGLAIGAAIAASLPITRRENEAFGEKSEALKETAREKASEQIEKAKDVAKAAADTAKEKAEEHGLPMGSPAGKTPRRRPARQGGTQSASVAAKAEDESGQTPVRSTPGAQRPAGSAGKPPSAS